MKFNGRGYRRKKGNGLTYKSDHRRYELYFGDRVADVELQPKYWFALKRTIHGQRLLSRHRTRKAAEKACESDLKQTEKL